jgi:hypothetical protein
MMRLQTAVDSRHTALRQMTPEQLLYLGTRQVVYLRSGMCDGEPAFVLHGADGAASGNGR